MGCNASADRTKIAIRAHFCLLVPYTWSWESAGCSPALRSDRVTIERNGRLIGALMMVQLVAGALVNFVLLEPLFAAPGFLVNAAAHASTMGATALLGIGAGLLPIGIAIAAFPVFRRFGEAWALWFITLAAVGLSITVAENISLMSLLSVSEAYARANAAERALFPAVRIVVASARNWTHYLGLILGGSNLLVFYGALYRFALIPRALAAFGLAAVSLQLASVALPLFGHDVDLRMLAPLGLCQLLVALWLLVQGWRAASPGEAPQSSVRR
jgi:hypothetical protein